MFIRKNQKNKTSTITADMLHIKYFFTKKVKLSTSSLPFQVRNLRKRRDSNPRYPSGYNSFQDCRLQPLGHASL